MTYIMRFREMESDIRQHTCWLYYENNPTLDMLRDNWRHNPIIRQHKEAESRFDILAD